MNTIACVVLVLMLAPLMVSGQSGSLAWDYDTTNDALCSATVTDDCVVAFELLTVQGSTETVVQRVPASVCSGSGMVKSCVTPAPPQKYGTTVWAARAIGKSGSVEEVSVNSNTVQDRRTPKAPANARKQ